ncbi:polysaccharide deacetylase family protein [Deinococcus lacus]|uniref:Polysaccharide deacetylase family protein n=1 Tax=Deinococcus lacus TaxID=392561 RepID=A0ABW1YCH3_9DEIO
MRRWLALVAGALALAGGAAQAGREGPPVTLVYHQVGVPGGPTLSISPGQLQARVRGLQQLGYRLTTTSQALAAQPGEAVAVIQFDDGLASVYEFAFPALRELGVPGTVYIIWDQVGQPGFMTAAQLRELQAAGWEIGHHTRSHAALPDLTPAGLAHELGAVPGWQPRCVAYPLNRQDARVRRAAQAQGLSCGVAGGPYALVTDPQALPAPAITPWDAAFLPQRAEWGVGGRTPLLLAGAVWPWLDRSGAEQPAAAAPLNWNPAHYELLGNGLYSFEWAGERQIQASWRAGDWALNLAARRGAGEFSGFGVAYNHFPVTLAAGLGTGGHWLLARGR